MIGATAVEGGYFLARSFTSAHTLSTAPDWYRLTFDLSVLQRNTSIYADQIATFPLLVLLVACLVLGRPRPAINRETTTVLLLGIVWVVGAFGLTIFLRTRSDLYACLPSLGLCLITTHWCDRSWRQAADVRQRRALVAVLIAVVALSPVYYLRTVHRSQLIAFAATTLDQLRDAAATLPDASVVVLEDDARARAENSPNLEDAFGNLLGDAYELTAGRRLHFRIELSGEEAGTQTVTPAALTLTVIDGQLRPVSSR